MHTTTDWLPEAFPAIILGLLMLLIWLLIVASIVYNVVRLAVKSATKEQRREAVITNQLLSELLRANQVSEVRIAEISKQRKD